MTKVDVQKTATLHGHKDCIYTLEKSLQDNFFFSAGGDGIVAKWDLNNPEIGDLIVSTSNSIYSLFCLKEKKQLIVGQNFEGLHLIDLTNKQELNSIKITSSAIFDIQVWQDEIFVACGDGVVIILDFESFTVKKHVKASDKSARSIAINPIERQFAVGYSDHFIRVFDLQTKDLLHTLKGHTNSVFTVKYTPDGTLLLSGSRDARLNIWQVEKNYQLYESIVAHMFAINHITFNPDGSFFATCSMDKSVKVWDSQSLKLVKVIDKARHAGHGTSVNKLLWTSYQNQLISASDDRTVSVWDLVFRD